MSMKKTGFAALGLLFVTTATFSSSEVYNIDTSHSFANFAIRHVVSKTSGSFNDIKGKLQLDRNNLANSSVDATINLLSINTGLAKRDDHIQKEEYLDAGKFSEIRFVSTKVEAQGANEGVVTGNFTMHGVTKQISFLFKVLGFGKDPWGGLRTGIEAHATLKASDYGFGWGSKPNAPVGDDIEVTLLIEGVKQK